MHKAEEKLFIDFTDKKFSYTIKRSGGDKRSECICCRIASQWVCFLCATHTQSREDVIEALKKMLPIYGNEGTNIPDHSNMRGCKNLLLTISNKINNMNTQMTIDKMKKMNAMGSIPQERQ